MVSMSQRQGTIPSDRCRDEQHQNHVHDGEEHATNDDASFRREMEAMIEATDAEVPSNTNNINITHAHDINESQPSTATTIITREEQLEQRVLHLEQSLHQLSQFCHTILANQQQQRLEHCEILAVENSNATTSNDDSAPNTPEEEEVNQQPWHPSTTQYAPLDSPDASLTNRQQRVSTAATSTIMLEDSDGMTVDGKKEVILNNMQMNSLSVKLGVTPYANHRNMTNNNQSSHDDDNKGKELDAKKKTMSMLFLDIEPGQSRGPNLITLDGVAASNEDEDSGGVDGVSLSDQEDGLSSERADDGRNDVVDENRVESGNGIIDDEQNDGRRSDDINALASFPDLHQKSSNSSPTLTTTVRDGLIDNGGNGGQCSNTKITPLPPRRRSSGLSSSLNTNPTQHQQQQSIKTEESLECQAYTPSHLEALRLRREVGKGRAYSCNDASISPPCSNRKGGVASEVKALPTISSPVWKPSFEALNGEEGNKPSITGFTLDRGGNSQVDNSGERGTIDTKIPQLILPDLTSKTDDKSNDGGNMPSKRKESYGSASSAGQSKVSVPPSASCASNNSSDTTKTPKSKNMKREVRSNSIPSGKERSQSVCSAKSKDSGVVVVANNDSATDNKGSETHLSTKKEKKSESKTSSSQQQQQSESGKKRTMSQYVINDLLNIDSRNHDGSATEDIDANMEEFLRIPSKFEHLMVFSLAVCVDSFLYPWAMLPLKFIWGLVCLACTVYKMIRKKKWTLNLNEADVHGIGFHRRHLYAILQSLLIWLVYSQILCPISIGKLYHWIRGQAMLKLYVLIAIVEVFDRLLCSFGQDAWDSLYWNTTRRPRHPRLLLSIVVVGVYVTIHSLFLFVHVATLSVAVNSADNALLTLLISGNFAEIKSTVFKKYNKQNLFKITTSDICERFKLALFLLLILFLNRFQGEMTSSMVNDYYSMCGIVFAAELVSDWIKHSFITKFNFIKSTAYFDYALVLSGDVTGIGHEGLNLDYTHAAVKRLGLAQIPLVCVTARYLHEAVRFAIAFKGNGDVDHPFSALVDLMADGSTFKFYIVLLKCMGFLVLFKVFTGIGIRAVARRNLGGDARVALKSMGSKGPKVKDSGKEAMETKKKQ